jgi:hypothetical protein
MRLLRFRNRKAYAAGRARISANAAERHRLNCIARSESSARR